VGYITEDRVEPEGIEPYGGRVSNPPLPKPGGPMKSEKRGSLAAPPLAVVKAVLGGGCLLAFGCTPNQPPDFRANGAILLDRTFLQNLNLGGR
jgi:hypothetical protein